MNLIRHPDAADFLRDTRPELEPREEEHSLLLGSALGLLDTGSSDAGAPEFVTVRDAEGLALAALGVPSRALVLASPREEAGAAVAFLAAQLARAGAALPAVEGPTALTAGFSAAWDREAGRPSRVVFHERLYCLTQVQPVPAVPGRLRPASAADVELVARWTLAFEQEALGRGSAEKARATAERRVAAGEVFLWEDGAVRCMAASARPTWSGVAVNSVYTPPGERGRGYAAACTARLSEHLLRQGRRFCVLFTDLVNPTSNRVYQRVGYRPLRDFRVDLLR